MIKKLFYFFIALLLGLVLFSYWKINSFAKVDPADYIEINPFELYKAYQENESQADQQYQGKTLIFEAEISQISKDASNATVFLLNANDNKSGLLATLGAGETLTDSKKGQMVKLRCSCSGFLADVILTNCKVLK